MKNFVLCYAVPIPLINWSDVLLMGSDKHNMPGGEVNDGEMPEQTADRVLRGIGITPSLADIRVMGVIQYAKELVHVCHCPFKVGAEREGPAVVGGTFWVPLNEAMKSKQVLHAAKLAVALCRSGLTNWAFVSNDQIIGLNLEGWQ